MRLRKGDEHSGVIGGAQGFGKAEMGSGFAPVVVGIDKVDAESSETGAGFADCVIGGQGCADFGVVERNGGKKYPLAVEVEVTAFNPELAEAEALVPACIQGVSAMIEQRELGVADMVGCMDVPKLFWFPFLCEFETAIFEVGGLELGAVEVSCAVFVLNQGPQLA